MTAELRHYYSNNARLERSQGKTSAMYIYIYIAWWIAMYQRWKQYDKSSVLGCSLRLTVNDVIVIKRQYDAIIQIGW